MKNGRIGKCFERAKREGRGAFVAYLTVGYPTLEKSVAAIESAIAGGADIIELGVPCADPFADGPVLREAARVALQNGVKMDAVFSAAKRIRARHPDTGLVLFAYYASIAAMGCRAFASSLVKSGIDAVLPVGVTDENRTMLAHALDAYRIPLVPLIAPDVPLERVREIAKGAGDTFIYAITSKGVTGVQTSLPPGLGERLDAIRSTVKLPVAAGFGISTKEQSEFVARHADGFVVGSALARRLGEKGKLEGELLR